LLGDAATKTVITKQQQQQEFPQKSRQTLNCLQENSNSFFFHYYFITECRSLARSGKAQLLALSFAQVIKCV